VLEELAPDEKLALLAVVESHELLDGVGLLGGGLVGVDRVLGVAPLPQDLLGLQLGEGFFQVLGAPAQAAGNALGVVRDAGVVGQKNQKLPPEKRLDVVRDEIFQFLVSLHRLPPRGGWRYRRV
jgi:hypothetical protein